MQPFAQQLVAALGKDIVLTASEDIEPWLADWRGIYKGRAQAVVRPRSTEQVATCLRLCTGAGVPVIPRGGNTGLCGAATPDDRPDNVIISLGRMNHIRAVDTVGNTMTVEAGCILSNLQEAASEAGRMLPLSLAAQGTCEIGGNLSTNAGGVNVVRYGMAREMVLGLEIVLPTGEILDELHPLRKDNTGYDLKQLFIGAEGTLGIITAAVLRLQPKLEARVVSLLALDSPDQALSAFESLYSLCGQRIQAYEYFTDDCVQLVHTQVPDVRSPFPDAHPCYVLVEVADTGDEGALNTLVEEAIGALLEQELCHDAVISTSLAQSQNLWRLREEISEAQRADGPHLKHDISIPIVRLPEFMGRAAALLDEQFPGVRPFVFGHFGDGNLHYNVSRPATAQASYFADHNGGEDVTAALLALVHEFRGSFSAEHGVGQLKKPYFAQYKSPVAIELMRRVKAAFDPAGIMNPGKIF